MNEKKCLECTKSVLSRDKRAKFCSRSCSATYANKHRTATSEITRAKISESLKIYFKNNPQKILRGEEHSQRIGKYTKGKYKTKKIKTFYEVSARTRSKIIKRLNLSCCVCGWNEASIDIHHIIPRKHKGSDSLENLCPLCPNHHRLAESKKLDKSLMKPLAEIVSLGQLNSCYFG